MLLQRERACATECSPLRRRVQTATAALLVAGTASLWGAAELPAQDPGAKLLREERDELRAQVRSLRAEVARLRAEIAAIGEKRRGELRFERVSSDEEPEDDPVLVEEIIEEMVEEEEPEEELELVEDPELVEEVLLDDVTNAPRSALVGAVPTASRDEYVVDLVTRAIDLKGELGIAKAELGTIRARYREKAAPAGQVEIGEIRIRTAERKYEVIAGMLRTEMHACALELDALERRLGEVRDAGRDGSAVEAQIVRVRGQLDMLRAAR